MRSLRTAQAKLRAAGTFTLRDWATLAQAWVLLLLVDLALRTLPFPRVRDAVRGNQMTMQLDRSTEWADIARLHRFVDVAARTHLVPMRCLRRALVLQRLLARRGIAAELRLGVNKDAERLNAHAWVEVDGTPVGERATVIEQFAPLQALRTQG